MTVARFGDRPASFGGPTRVFPGHEPDVRHELRGLPKTPPIDDLGGERDRCRRVDPAQATQPRHALAQGGRQREVLDLVIQGVAALLRVAEQPEELAEDGLVLSGEDTVPRQLLEPRVVGARPVTLAGRVAQAAPR